MSWESSGSWYDRIVGEKGHYYHQQVVLPGALRLLDLAKTSSPRLLDLACGQGILSRHLPKDVAYVGVDVSTSLIKAARAYDKKSTTQFHVGDVTKPLPIKERDFTHATILLALQNIEDGLAVIKNAAAHLAARGKLVIVLNHPCYRIPRQSSWGIDAPRKIQYRRIDRYFSPMKIPIQTNPGRQEASAQTISYHHPLSTYSQWLHQAGFAIQLIEEWCSDKKSTGKTAAMENRSRKEFPLFLTLLAEKQRG